MEGKANRFLPHSLRVLWMSLPRRHYTLWQLCDHVNTVLLLVFEHLLWETSPLRFPHSSLLVCILPLLSLDSWLFPPALCSPHCLIPDLAPQLQCWWVFPTPGCSFLLCQTSLGHPLKAIPPQHKFAMFWAPSLLCLLALWFVSQGSFLQGPLR